MEKLGTGQRTSKPKETARRMVFCVILIEVPALSVSGGDSQGADTPKCSLAANQSNIPGARNKVL